MNHDNWYIIQNFSFNDVIDHIKIFKLLSQNDCKIIFRKDIMDYANIDKDLRQEILSDNFEYYLSDTLHIDSENTRQKIEISIKDIFLEKYGETKENQQVIHDKNILLKDLLKIFPNIDIETLNRIKIAIFTLLNSSGDSCEIYKKDRLCFINTHSISFRNFFSNGCLENKPAKYQWYEIKGEEELENVIQNNKLYNAIITKDTNNFTNFM